AETLTIARLDGTASSVLSGIRWVQVSGPSITLSGADTATPSFTAPDLPTGADHVSLGFQLSVGQNGILSKPVTVGVEVGKRPVADAGRAQSVAAAGAVTLDGS